MEQKSFLHDPLFKALMDMEEACYPPSSKARTHQRRNEIARYVDERATGYVTVRTLSNLGFEQASITVDRYVNGASRSLYIELCACGATWVAKEPDLKLNGDLVVVAGVDCQGSFMDAVKE